MGDRKAIQLGELAAPGRSVISGPFGSSIGKRFFRESGVPVIRGNNLTTDYVKFLDEGFVFLTQEKADNLNAYAIENDLIFTAAGTIGQVGMIPKDASYDQYVISNKQLRFRVDPQKADIDYVYFWLASPWIYTTIQNRNTGSTVPLINLGTIRSLPVELPVDILEQQKIAAVLSALDAKIELNNRINAELEAMAKTLYDYWFVQFDFPYDFAQGKPDANGRPYKSSGGKMVHNETLKRDIPEGWDVPAIGKIFNTSLGGTPARKKKEYWMPPEVNWLNSEDKASLCVVSADEYISNAGLNNSAAKLLPVGTVILSIVRHLRASILGVEAATNQSVVGIEETDSIKNSFIYPLILREIPRYMKQRTGAQQPHINKEAVDQTSFVLPDKAVLEKYQQIADPIFSEIQNNTFQNQHLTSLRDFLLPMLMNGQVQVM